MRVRIWRSLIERSTLVSSSPPFNNCNALSLNCNFNHSMSSCRIWLFDCLAGQVPAGIHGALQGSICYAILIKVNSLMSGDLGENSHHHCHRFSAPGDRGSAGVCADGPERVWRFFGEADLGPVSFEQLERRARQMTRLPAVKPFVRRQRTSRPHFTR